VLIVAATTSGNVLGAAGPRRWDRAINALVPAALIAAMIAHAFPFIVPHPGLYPIDLNTGFSAFFIGFLSLDAFFAAFSLPLIAAFVGLMYQRRPGWIGSLVPLVCSVVGLTCLGSAYFLEKQEPLAYGYFAAEASFLLGAVASAVRLIRLRRNRALWDAKVDAPFEPARDGWGALGTDGRVASVGLSIGGHISAGPRLPRPTGPSREGGLYRFHGHQNS
jgi:hypothetical protein